MKSYLFKNVLGVFALSGRQVISFEPFLRDAKKIAGELSKEATDIEELNLKIPDLDILLDHAGVTREEYYKLVKEVSFNLARSEIGKLQKDKLISQAVEAQKDLEEALNILSERMREWYSLHFPELEQTVEDHLKFLEYVKTYGNRENFPPDFEGLITPGKSSIGAGFGQEDIKILQLFSTEILRIYEFKEELGSYIESVMDDVAPNLSAFSGPVVGAMLISQAKGLENLAKMPSCRVQILGAQKAMFRHIKKGGDPPKHGVIFQHPSIKTAKWWQRGKIARSFSGKASIAVKADAFSSNFIADGLKKDFKKRLKEIKEKYQNEPKKMRIIRYKPPKEKKRRRKR